MNKISTYRKQLGLSQRQLATHLGWIQSRLANYEANFRTPGLEECRKIVATLNHLGSRCVLDDVFPPHVNDSRTILAKVRCWRNIVTGVTSPGATPAVINIRGLSRFCITSAPRCAERALSTR